MDYDLILQEKKPIDESFFVYNKDGNIFWGNTLDEIKKKFKDFFEDENMLPIINGQKQTKEEISTMAEQLEEKDLKKIEIKIMKPDYSTNSSILENSITVDSTGIPKIDFIKYNQYRILYLLKDWNINHNDKKSAISMTTLGYIHPIIIEAFISKINNNIPHYFGLLYS